MNVDLDRSVLGEPVEVRYDLAEFDDHRVLVIRAASRATAYDLVITKLEHFPIHNNGYVIALVNLGPAGHVWNLPHLAGWHWSYLAKGRRDDLNEVTATTIAKILDDAARFFDQWDVT